MTGSPSRHVMGQGVLLQPVKGANAVCRSKAQRETESAREEQAPANRAKKLERDAMERTSLDPETRVGRERRRTRGQEAWSVELRYNWGGWTGMDDGMLEMLGRGEN